jgi:LPS O-antigen subunit length determinant protein (WzzB/FepE family)
MQRIAEFIVANWDAIAGIAVTVIAWLWSRPVIAERKAKADEWLRVHRLNAAVDIATGIVSEVYRATVRELKSAGKFDADAKARVANEAASALRRELTENGLAMLQNLAPALVELAVNRMKVDAITAAPVDGPELVQ